MWLTGAKFSGSGETFFIVSYVEKNTAAVNAHRQEPEREERIRRDLPPGALPTTTLPIPLYIPLSPPARANPCADWRRVLMVSMGKKRRSTAVPAAPPA